MTDYERIRDQFNSATICRHGKRPQLEYEPGCMYVECAEGAECRCRLNDGEGSSANVVLLKWQRLFGK